MYFICVLLYRKRPVATGVNRFLAVLLYFPNCETGNQKNPKSGQPQPAVRLHSVASGPVSVFFFSPCNWTCRHYIPFYASSTPKDDFGHHVARSFADSTFIYCLFVIITSQQLDHARPFAWSGAGVTFGPFTRV